MVFFFEDGCYYTVFFLMIYLLFIHRFSTYYFIVLFVKKFNLKTEKIFLSNK